MSRNLFTPYPCCGQDKCRKCFKFSPYPLQTLGSRVCGVSKPLQCLACGALPWFRSQVGNSCSTFSFLRLWVTSWSSDWLQSFCLVFSRFEWECFYLIVDFHCRSSFWYLDGLVFWRCRFSAEVSRQKFVVSVKQCSWLVVLSSSSSSLPPLPFPPRIVLDLGTRSTVGGSELSQPKNPPQFKFSFIALLCCLSDLFAVFASPN